jgi:hypothetical protein
VRACASRLASGARAGIEFLEYITPPGGRPLPGDAKANDLIFWQTWLHVDALNPLEQRLHSSGAHLFRAAKTPGSESCAIPDGHALRLVAVAQRQIKSPTLQENR